MRFQRLPAAVAAPVEATGGSLFCDNLRGMLMSIMPLSKAFRRCRGTGWDNRWYPVAKLLVTGSPPA
jgi:hypothetical protein